jgi:hypothetical protein
MNQYLKLRENACSVPFRRCRVLSSTFRNRCSIDEMLFLYGVKPNNLVYSLSLHRHSYIGFILAFASSIHNKQTSLYSIQSSRPKCWSAYITRTNPNPIFLHLISTRLPSSTKKTFLTFSFSSFFFFRLISERMLLRVKVV